MILKIRKSRSFKSICITLALCIFFELVAPTQAMALTGGPAQPEFNSFTPIGTSDMVDLSSGDMNYNIPLMDVGGYPLNIAYSSGVSMDEEASFVGLGWNLSVGQITRNVRGIPDDFQNDQIQYENNLKDNVTAGATFAVTPDLFGVEVLDITLGASAIYNNYSGFSIKPSVGIQLDLGKAASVGFNVESGPDGLCVSPSLSIHQKSKKKNDRNTSLSANIGASFNTRQGLTSASLSMTKKATYKQTIGSTKGKMQNGSASIGSSISFTDQTYTPSRRVGMETGSFTVNAAIGGEVFGVEGQGQITGFGTVVKMKKSEQNKLVGAYGYNNSDLAGQYDILDFNREKDASFSVNSTNMAVTNYTYDIYSVQGQGVSGMYRPYRNQVGYVYDARVEDASISSAFGFEVGAGNAFHAGIDIEATFVESHSGLWENNNYILDYLKENYDYNPKYEKVHHKNVGDLSADEDFVSMSTKVGDYQPVRVEYQGDKFNRFAVNNYKQKTDGSVSGSTVNENTVGVTGKIKRTERLRRNQAIYNVSNAELANGSGFGPLKNNTGGLPSEAKGHHTGEVQIVRNDGARYVYGLPAYNKTKRETTFAVDGIADCNAGLVSYDPGNLTDESTWSSLPNDKYFNRVTTPGYVHTHLLTSVLSTDYQDREGDGPTADDFGSYTKFSYIQKHTNYNWRVPYQQNKASYNEGLKTDDEDDQGNYVFGSKEMYLIDKIETKTHIAVFHYSKRKDAIGVEGEHGGMASSSLQYSYKLDKISLYSIGEYYNQDPIPIKEVNFEYSYSLCPGVPNNVINATGAGATTHLAGYAAEDNNEISNRGGKLTLKKIFFTYRNSAMGKYTGYKFNYGEYKTDGLLAQPDEYSSSNPSGLVLNTDLLSGGTGRNPSYNIKGYDSWGNYMPNIGGCANTDMATSSEFPFTEQDDLTEQNRRSSVWSLNSISLPSGGNISIEYETDEYGSVQDKTLNRMFKVQGAGNSSDGTSVVSSSGLCGELFSLGLSNTANQYLYIQIADDATSNDVASYLQELESEPIYFRFLMNMTQLGSVGINDNTAKFDYVTGYFQHDGTLPTSFFEDGSGFKYLSLPVQFVDKSDGSNPNVHPISKAAWHFGRKYLSPYVYDMHPNGSSNDIEDLVGQLVGVDVLNNLKEIFTGPNGALEDKGVGRRFIKEKSWVRLKEPDGKKFGGGCRVSSIRMSDVWEAMQENTNGGYQTMRYGQKYEYTLADGTTTSGVATYEPVGNKENPFVQPVFSSTEKLLAPDEENFVEKPFGESFFPNPQVTYSRVTVSNLQAGDDHPDSNYELKRLHKTGRVVTEFYTTKDYPTIVDQTTLECKEDKQDALGNLLGLYVRNHFIASQGYVIHLNDMNGKQKAQWVYAEGQTAPISGVEYKYDNNQFNGSFNAGTNPETNRGKLNNLVTVINPNGTVGTKTIGVEIDVVNDFRENETTTEITGVNTNLATFFVGVFPGLVPIPLPDYAHSEDRFRSVSTTKVINTFGILRETIAHDAGASVSTRNLAWDAVTGEVLVTQTVDEFNDIYYTLNYPAHWVYDGMAQASKNLGFTGTCSNSGSIGDGIFQVDNLGIGTAEDYLIAGDEMLLTITPTYPAPPIYKMAWVLSVSGNQIHLIDEDGANVLENLGNDYSFEVVRSGHRNLQSAGIMNVTLMENPLLSSTGFTDAFLTSDDWVDWRIINAGAVDYSDEWGAGCECGTNTGQVGYNPYRLNEKGVWRTKSSRTFLAGRNSQTDVTPSQQGFFTEFVPMYIKQDFLTDWDKDMTAWTYVAEVTNYSPYGFELENKDALNRYSAAQYGYNNTFPVAVGANTKYSEIGFDGFEDENFVACPYSSHFHFSEGGTIVSGSAHTGKHSIMVVGNSRAKMKKKLTCAP